MGSIPTPGTEASRIERLFNLICVATVYILFSKKLNRFYTGSCKDLSQRLDQHKKKVFEDCFTAKADDWEVFLSIDELAPKSARLIESHIKKNEEQKLYTESKEIP